MPEFIHFRGKDAILEAYERQGIPACTLVSGKDIIFCYDGDSIEQGSAELGEFIDALKVGLSQGVYTLRVYKNPPKEINLSTKQNLSFKCRILDPDEMEEKNNGYAQRFYEKRISDLEAKLSGMPDEEEEEMPIWQSTVAGILQRPDVQNFLMTKIFGIVEKFFGPAGQQPAAAVSGVPEAVQSTAEKAMIDATALYNGLSPEQRQRMDAAIGVLLQNDPEVGTNLLKIAMFLQKDPGKYRTYLSMI